MHLIRHFAEQVRYDRRERLSKDTELGLFYGTRGFRDSARGTFDFGGGLKLLQSSLETGGGTGTKPVLDLGGLVIVGDLDIQVVVGQRIELFAGMTPREHLLVADRRRQPRVPHHGR